MKQQLSLVFACILLCWSFLSGCSTLISEKNPNGQNNNQSLLTSTREDAQSYLDSFVFLGESTTYHLKNRGVLSGGTNTKQVWGPANGTINLDTTITKLKIVYPETGELLSIGEAVAKKSPPRMLLCFGLNGAVAKIQRGKSFFQSCYRLLLDEIRANAPHTEIYLQSAFPVAQNMDMSAYSVDVDTLNRYIEAINDWSRELAKEYGIIYLNTAEVLRDDTGRLRMEYQNGDGHHLTTEAYQKMLAYILAHHEKEGSV